MQSLFNKLNFNMQPWHDGLILEQSITTHGDMWLLGPHRILCADSLNYQHMQQLTGGINPGLIIALPNCRINSVVCKLQPSNNLVNSFEAMISHYTRPNQIILGLFTGCGCLLTACENSKRTAYLINSQPHAIDSMVQQWQLKTGQNAILKNSGWSFNELLSWKKMS